MPKKILLLHDAPEAPPAVVELAQELRAGGAEVSLVPCAEPCGSVLDAVAAADSVVYRVTVLGDAALLQRTLALDGRLRPQDGVGLSYLYQP